MCKSLSFRELRAVFQFVNVYVSPLCPHYLDVRIQTDALGQGGEEIVSICNERSSERSLPFKQLYLTAQNNIAC